jgi:hypothetical protein
MKPAEALAADHPIRLSVIQALRTYLEVDSALRSNPQSIRSSPPPDNEEGRAYLRLQELYHQAYAALWAATDFEYAEDGFRDVCWKWRYWKVMARKCCWYQRGGAVGTESVFTTIKIKLFGAEQNAAALTMAELHRAEDAMVEACGLLDSYRSSGSYLKQHFPNLK